MIEVVRDARQSFYGEVHGMDSRAAAMMYNVTSNSQTQHMKLRSGQRTMDCTMLAQLSTEHMKKVGQRTMDQFRNLPPLEKSPAHNPTCKGFCSARKLHARINYLLSAQT